MSKNLLITLVLFFMLNLNADASMVSFFVLETGVADNLVNNEHSMNWESAFMDVFFDAGHIVSNASSLRMRTRPEDIENTASFEIEDARRGGVDFLFIIQIDYNADSPTPENIIIYLYKMIPFTKITERAMTARTYRSSREELDDYKSIVRGFIPLIN